MTTKKYLVYVSDDHGWLDSCPDYQGVFFGHADLMGGCYVPPEECDHSAGAVEFGSQAEAVAFQKHLSVSGDWTRRDDAVQDESRPTYAIASA